MVKASKTIKSFAAVYGTFASGCRKAGTLYSFETTTAFDTALPASITIGNTPGRSHNRASCNVSFRYSFGQS
jgi:hypothetical protein